METLCNAVDILNSHSSTKESGVLVTEDAGNNKVDVKTNVVSETLPPDNVLLLEPGTTDIVIKEELVEMEPEENNLSSTYEVKTADGEIQHIVRYIQIKNIDEDAQTKGETSNIEANQNFEVCEISMNDWKEIADGTQILQVLYVPQDLDSSAENSKCVICSRNFSSVEELKQHMSTHNPKPHFRELRAIMTQTDESLLQSNPAGEQSVASSSRSQEEEATTSAIKADEGTSASHLKNTVSSINLETVKNSKKISNTCQVCFKTFVSASKLIRHSYLHTGEKPFGCDICHRRFTQIAHLKVHMELHTGQYVYRKLFQCPYCAKKFSSKSNIQTHMVIHSGIKAYKCNQCGKAFSLSSHLKRHEFSHSGKKPFTCQICKKSFTTKFSMMIHSRQHTGERPFPCNLCGKSFYDNTHLKRHMNSHEKLYKCSKCPSRFVNMLRLNSHLKTHGRVENNVQTAEDVVKLVQSIKKSTPKSTEHKVRKYRTQQPLSPSLPVVRLSPNESESSVDDISLNVLNVDNVLQQDSVHSYSLKSKNGDTKEHDVKNKCNICGKGFAHPSNLLKHKKTVHSSVRAYKCDVCQRSFTQNAHLKVHKKTLHPDPGEKTLYQCGICFRQFNVQKNAERHMKQIHLGQEQKKYLKCKLCDKTFAFPVQLKRHFKQHENETSRECDRCGKKFISSWHFMMHYRTHTGEKPYQCELCELKFADKSALTRHNRCTHEKVSRETCGICNKTFSSKGHLVKHFKRHPETRRAVLMAQGNTKDYMPDIAEQKYQCGECQQEFTYFTNALAHMKVHSENGEVPLKCPFCEEDFNDMNVMKKHIRKHTGEPEPERSQVCNFCSKRFFKKKTLKAHLESIHSNIEGENTAIKMKHEPGLKQQLPEQSDSVPKEVVTANVVENSGIVETFQLDGVENSGNQVTLQVLKQEQGLEDNVITVVVMDNPAASETKADINTKVLQNEAAKVLHALTDIKTEVIELDNSALSEPQTVVKIESVIDD